MQPIAHLFVRGRDAAQAEKLLALICEVKRMNRRNILAMVMMSFIVRRGFVKTGSIKDLDAHVQDLLLCQKGQEFALFLYRRYVALRLKSVVKVQGESLIEVQKTIYHE